MKNLYNTLIKAMGLGPKPTFKELLQNYKPIDAVAETRARNKNQYQPPIWMMNNMERIDTNRFPL